MRLAPMGKYLPVHCCCDPNKRLGWVPRFGREEGGTVFVAGQPSRDLETGAITPAEIIRTEIAWLHNHPGYDDDVLAVKSAEVPIETWRKVAGWIDEQDTSVVKLP